MRKTRCYTGLYRTKVWTCSASLSESTSWRRKCATPSMDMLPERAGSVRTSPAEYREVSSYERERKPYRDVRLKVLLPLCQVGDQRYRDGNATRAPRSRFRTLLHDKNTGHGSGLGLSMVCGFVEQSGGLTEVYSEPGVGSTIRIHLCRYWLARASHARPPSREGMVQSSSWSRPRQTLGKR